VTFPNKRNEDIKQFPPNKLVCPFGCIQGRKEGGTGHGEPPTVPGANRY